MLWHRWTPDRRQQHVQQFHSYCPTVASMFVKPINAGRKANFSQRKRSSTEPIIVEDRVQTSADDAPLTPLVVKKRNGQYECKKKKSSDLALIDPRRAATKPMFLRLKTQHKLVSRYTAPLYIFHSRGDWG